MQNIVLVSHVSEEPSIVYKIWLYRVDFKEILYSLVFMKHSFGFFFFNTGSTNFPSFWFRSKSAADRV